jgi:hypothetical protein
MVYSPSSKRPAGTEVAPGNGAYKEEPDQAGDHTISPIDAPQRTECLEVPLHTRLSKYGWVGAIRNLSHGSGGPRDWYRRAAAGAKPAVLYNIGSTSLTDHIAPPDKKPPASDSILL